MNVGINGVSGWGGRWMFSQQGEAGEVQLVLASGQSFCAPCLSKHHPRVHKQEHFPSPGPPCYPLYPVSKLTLSRWYTFNCPPPAPSLLTCLHDLWYLDVNQKKKEKICACFSGCGKKKARVLLPSPYSLRGAMMRCSTDVRWMLRVVLVVVWM